MNTAITGTTPIKHPLNSSLNLNLLSRFSLPRATHCQPTQALLLAGGQWLVAIADLGSPRFPQEGPNCAGISIWDLRDTSSPRCVIDVRNQLTFPLSLAAEAAEAVDDPSPRQFKVLLGHFRSSQVTVYHFDLSSDVVFKEPTPVVYEMPLHPDHGVDSLSVERLTCTWDVFACVVEVYDLLVQFNSNPDAQTKPLVPANGADQIYLVHMPTKKSRWIHPRHLSSFHPQVHILIRDDCIYLLGRTLTTYLLRQYQFSPTMIYDGPDDIFIDLGEPLSEQESSPLPNPGIPWGSHDREMVCFHPSSHVSILALREYFAEGYHIRFPFQTKDQDQAKASASASGPELVAVMHLPDDAMFFPRWLGREQALVFSQDDTWISANKLIDLSFPSRSELDALAKGASFGVGASSVRHEDVSWGTLVEEHQLQGLGDPCAINVDDYSGRICILLSHGEGLVLSRT